MLEISLLEPVDYLLIGHLTLDHTPLGLRLGGTAAYASLTAKALGLKVGIVTSWGGEIPLSELDGIPVASFPTERSTSFKNIYSEGGRTQYLLQRAEKLDFYQVPEPWRNASIVHLGPVADEVEPGTVRMFSSSLLCVTPQGWLRSWDQDGMVTMAEWPEAPFVLEKVGAAVISLEDVNRNEDRIDELASSCPVLAVTEGNNGSRLYWNGDVRRFRPPPIIEVDATGAGDIFAAGFFTRLSKTHDPWEAARFATKLSAFSVTRVGLQGIPTAEEINACLVEVF